ncbi:MFS transporter [Aeromonas jandaei]
MQETMEQDTSRSTLHKVATACFIGNFIEWFDYAVYGYLAIVISRVFFPYEDQTAGLLATFAIFAFSFVVRPLGGVFWGHQGDRVGRRNVLSISILLMSASTFGIALLPSYSSIGFVAPLLLCLCRLVQSFSASGEYAGSVIFIAEYAPKHQRGLYVGLIPASTAIGLLAGALCVALLQGMLEVDQLESWGWRIPFLIAAPMGIIGRYIRVNLEDTPEFSVFQSSGKMVQAPIVTLLRHYKRALLVLFGVTSLNAVGFYFLLSYMPTYLTATLGVSFRLSVLVTIFTLMVYGVFVFFAGYLSDCFGRPRMLMLASFAFIVLSVPVFSQLTAASSLSAMMLIVPFFGLLLSINDGALACFIAELFPVEIRYSGFAFGFNTVNALFGGTTPLVLTWLTDFTGEPLVPAYYLALVGLGAFGASACFYSTDNSITDPNTASS